MGKFEKTNDNILLDFLQEWLDWVDAGAQDSKPFLRGWGLCSNTRSELQRCSLRSALAEDFGDINASLPFSDANEYAHRADERTQHECPKRLAWVKAKLGIDQ